jgi:hypothetical protein
MHGRELVAQSLFPVGMCGGEFAAYLRKQYDQFSLVIREANIRQNDPLTRAAVTPSLPVGLRAER